MRTKASVNHHPIHPALVVYPIAFLHGAFAFGLAGRITKRRELDKIGRRLGLTGIIAGAAAAVPGMIDYLYTVPPRSSGKRRATKHMIANGAALTLFGLAQLRRRGNGGESDALVLAAEGIGSGLLFVGASLGSTLVNRNFIGPVHRYPEARRDSEAEIPYRPGEPVAVAREGELEVDQMKLLRINGQRIVLGRTEEGYVAFDDRCTHEGASLADGVMVCGTVQCLWHGSQFDAETGEVRAGPAAEPIETYPIEVVGGEVRLMLEPESVPLPARGRPGTGEGPTLGRAGAPQPGTGVVPAAGDETRPGPGRAQERSARRQEGRGDEMGRGPEPRA